MEQGDAMNSVFAKFRKTMGHLLMLLLQGSALLLGAASTPSCAYGPPENEYDYHAPEDGIYYDGHQDADQAATDLLAPDTDVTPRTDLLIPDQQETVAPDVQQDIADVQEDEVEATLYGVQPVDVTDLATVDTLPDARPDTDCEPMDMYGPPPCTEDADCANYGTDYYCDKTNTVNDSCGNPINYPVCAKKEE